LGLFHRAPLRLRQFLRFLLQRLDPFVIAHAPSPKMLRDVVQVFARAGSAVGVKVAGRLVPQTLVLGQQLGQTSADIVAGRLTAGACPAAGLENRASKPPPGDLPGSIPARHCDTGPPVLSSWCPPTPQAAPVVERLELAGLCAQTAHRDPDGCCLQSVSGWTADYTGGPVTAPPPSGR
jgi:hypothetical protein